MSDFSFDIVCKVNKTELTNALDAAKKEITNRFDFKGTHVKIEQEKEEISIESTDDMKVKQIIDVIQSKFAKRDLNLKAFSFGEFEKNVNGIVKCQAKIQNGLTAEQCKKITKYIKDSKLKVQGRIQEDTVRASSKSKDELQVLIQKLKNENFDFALSFENYR